MKEKTTTSFVKSIKHCAIGGCKEVLAVSLKGNGTRLCRDCLYWEKRCEKQNDSQKSEVCTGSHGPTLTLDDLRPKGRWNPLPEDDREQMLGDQCSLCGYEHFGSRFNFCPSCGAKMENGA